MTEVWVCYQGRKTVVHMGPAQLVVELRDRAVSKLVGASVLGTYDGGLVCLAEKIGEVTVPSSERKPWVLTAVKDSLRLYELQRLWLEPQLEHLPPREGLLTFLSS
eukprot:Colp12_sorted_trinity150504_noHs@28374